jgi:hypothetical protein
MRWSRCGCRVRRQEQCQRSMAGGRYCMGGARMARLGSGEKERGGVMQGGVCGDGMGARRTAVVLLASGGGRRPAAQLGYKQCSASTVLGVCCKAGGTAMSGGRKWTQKGAVRRMEGRVVYGMNRSAGGARYAPGPSNGRCRRGSWLGRLFPRYGDYGWKRKGYKRRPRL